MRLVDEVDGADDCADDCTGAEDDAEFFWFDVELLEVEAAVFPFSADLTIVVGKRPCSSSFCQKR